MIKRLIRGLRKKPKSSRDNIAFSVAAVITVMIFSIWIYHMPARLSAIAERHQPEGENTSAFSGLMDSIGNQVSAVKESLSSGDATSTAEMISQLFSTSTDSAEVSSPTPISGGYSSSSKYTWGSEVDTNEAASSSPVEQNQAPEPKAIRIMATETSSTTASSTHTDQ